MKVVIFSEDSQINHVNRVKNVVHSQGTQNRDPERIVNKIKFRIDFELYRDLFFCTKFYKEIIRNKIA